MGGVDDAILGMRENVKRDLKKRSGWVDRVMKEQEGEKKGDSK